MTDVDARDGAFRAQELLVGSVDGLRAMYDSTTRQFAQTARGVPGAEGPLLVPKGTNLRYSAIVALGLSRVAPELGARVLSGDTVDRLVDATLERAEGSDDAGAVALAAWAGAEVSGAFADGLFAQLHRWLKAGVPIATVDLAWMLTAAIAAQDLGDATYVLSRSRSRLLSVQGLDGLFPHAVPAASQGRLRMHVGSFADQIYPIQALARASSATDDDLALDGANLCARQICDLQGEAGQWWWHYDARNGSVVEPYPVYSVHQHGMAPMALADLAAAGGEDQRAAAQLGLGWLDTHPETVDRLVDERFGVIWRKVGRREPRKAARKVRAVVSAVRPGLQTRFIDRLFPPGPIDHECRPYELGWLMYAWGTEHPRPHLRSLISTDDAEGADDAGLRSERDSA